MLFSDYIKILKSHCKKTISIQKLCVLLFDFVIDNATLEDGETAPVEIGKDRISKMMNGKDVVHQFIRNHIYDDSVTDSLIFSFQKKVLPKLVDDTDDLIFQLMQKINHDNISPSHKAMFKRNAKKESLAVFLADTFQYAIATNSDDHFEKEKTNKMPTPQASFAVKGISGHKITDIPIIKKFEEKIGYSKDTLLDNIEREIKEALTLRVDHYEPKTSGMLTLFRGQQYEYEICKINLISKFSEMLSIKLPEDFFDMGDLFVNPIPKIGQYGQFINSVDGSKEAKNKLKVLNTIYDSILDASDKAPFLNVFSDLFYLELAMENKGNDFDEDIRVVLRFPQGSIIKPETVNGFEKRAVNYFVFEDDSLMQIERGEDYLSFYEEKVWIPPQNYTLPISGDREATAEDILEVMRYYFASSEDYDMVEIKFDAINQYTSVAFPCPILLKNNNIKEIEYSIRSKKSPDILHGKIKLSR